MISEEPSPQEMGLRTGTQVPKSIDPESNAKALNALRSSLRATCGSAAISRDCFVTWFLAMTLYLFLLYWFRACLELQNTEN